MSGKGKGKHVARKNKFARGKSGMTTALHKEERGKKHNALLAAQSTKKGQRLNMLADVKATFPKQSNRTLRKMFGTLNIRRMTDILNGTYETAQWYLNHKALQEARHVVRHVNHYGKFRKKDKKSHNKDKAPTIPTSPDQGSGETQVDRVGESTT